MQDYFSHNTLVLTETMCEKILGLAYVVRLECLECP